MMLTQIYEVSTAAQALAIAAIGVDHSGIKVGEGEVARELSPVEAVAIADGITPASRVCALFLTSDLSYIVRVAQRLRPHIVHLGATLLSIQPDDVRAMKAALPDCLIMRTVPVADETALAVAQSYEGVADYLLLDSCAHGKVGALGVTHDWRISRRIVEAVRVPVFLAGGLGPDNVVEAIQLVRPAGVDSKSKTDQDGSHLKDLLRVRLFHEAARAAL